MNGRKRESKKEGGKEKENMRICRKRKKIRQM